MIYPMRMWPKFLVMVSVVFLLLGCSSQTTPNSPAAFVNSAVPEGFSFPHPEGVADVTKHGAWVTQAGRTLCLNCHKNDADMSLPGPACNSCHTIYPHPDGWATITSHGKYVIDNGTTSCQTKCHGTDLAGGLNGVACNKCHELYPHATGWVSQGLHGPNAIGNGKDTCKLCHGDNFNGGQSGTPCSDCHAAYPHAAGWLAASDSIHGPVVAVQGSTQCESCHGANDAGSIFNTTFCNACHLKHESSPTACKPCHEAGTGLTDTRPQGTSENHLTTQDCVSCHDYSTGAFKILRGETLDFTLTGHGNPSAPGVNGAFAKKSSSVTCMRCHTKTGFTDYIHDGSQDAAALASATTPDPLVCGSCHNADTASYGDGVTIMTNGFNPGDNPANYKRVADGGSGTHIDITAGKEGICLRCHAPRSSDGAIKVNAWVYGTTTPDTVYTSASTYTYGQYPANDTATPAGKVSSSQNRGSSVTFHHLPILATFYGNDAKEGFQYQTDPDGNALTYIGKNNRMVSSDGSVAAYDTCIRCHNPHTTQAQPAKCASCHTAVSSMSDYENIRVSTADYDGDGNTTEGMFYELGDTDSTKSSDGVKGKLYAAIQNYAKYRTGLAGEIELALVAKTTPYAQSAGSWYVKGTATAYNKWTPRLVKAAYNYHLAYTEQAAYVHNAKYMIQLLYDSIKDLNKALSDVTLMSDGADHQVDMTGMVRPTTP